MSNVTTALSPARWTFRCTVHQFYRVYTFQIADIQYTAALPAQQDKSEKQWIRVRGMRGITVRISYLPRGVSSHNFIPRFNKRFSI